MLRLLIPAYNESDQLPSMLMNVKEVLKTIPDTYEILIVDDGSVDGTSESIQELTTQCPITIVKHPRNLGVSAAFRTGFDYWLERSDPSDFLLTMEANKNADPTIIPSMLAEINQGADLVLASCYAPGGKVIGDPLLRLILSKGINTVLSLLFPAGGVHTYTSFYRLWRCDFLLRLKEMTGGRYFEQEGFVCMADMLLKASRSPHVKIREVPLTLISDIGQSGSKMKIGKTMMGYFKLIYSNLIHQSQ